MPVKALRLSELSPARQKLLRTCQQINFGYLENLHVRQQEPVFADTPPSVLLDIKLDIEPVVIPSGSGDDFELCVEFCRLMSLLDAMGNGRISRIDIRHGVPRKLLFEQSFANQTTTDS